jgi:hypothetical protein
MANAAAMGDADYLAALVNVAPRLLSAAREVETLRAQLRDVTAERDELRERMALKNAMAADRALFNGGL